VTPAIYLYLEEFQEKVLNRTSFFRDTRVHAGEHAPENELSPAGTAHD